MLDVVEDTEEEVEEDQKTNTFYRYSDFMPKDALANILLALINGEYVKWFLEPYINAKATPKEVKIYIQKKVFDFPIITEIARDFLAIPATLAPSKQVFSLASNLISKKRTRVTSKNVRYILCLRSQGVLKELIDKEEMILDQNRRPIVPLEAVAEVTGIAKHLDF